MNIEKFANCVLDSILLNKDGFKSLFEQWFEQNPQEPVVVGLTDEQKKNLIKRFADNFGIQRYRVEQSFNDLYKNLTFESNEESIAATRLYHAAPDLLEALTDLFNDVMYLGFADECDDSFQKASRAIAKATQ